AEIRACSSLMRLCSLVHGRRMERCTPPDFFVFLLPPIVWTIVSAAALCICILPRFNMGLNLGVC
uniref:Uncharacterized protein n=1 Tax=Aegilops tauschii subsp. strangulata TaxID=200361 RepID=A0A453RLB1_AEGTS